MAALRIAVLALLVSVAAASTPCFAGGVEDPSGLSKDEVISADALRRLQEEKANFVLFDARYKPEYDKTHIAGAVLPLPLKFYNDQELFKQRIIPTPPNVEPALAEAMKAYPKDQRIVTYCNRNCTASVRLLREIKKLGYTHVQTMEEGLQAWQEKGYPTVVAT